MGLRCDRDDRVERARDEVCELQLDDGPLAHPRCPDRRSDEALLRDRRVDDALLAELLEHVFSWSRRWNAIRLRCPSVASCGTDRDTVSFFRTLPSPRASPLLPGRVHPGGLATADLLVLVLALTATVVARQVTAVSRWRPDDERACDGWPPPTPSPRSSTAANSSMSPITSSTRRCLQGDRTGGDVHRRRSLQVDQRRPWARRRRRRADLGSASNSVSILRATGPHRPIRWRRVRRRRAGSPGRTVLSIARRVERSIATASPRRERPAEDHAQSRRGAAYGCPDLDRAPRSRRRRALPGQAGRSEPRLPGRSRRSSREPLTPDPRDSVGGCRLPASGGQR